MTVATEDDVFEAMKDVVDPELGINVVDLGLVYGVSVDDANIATIDMTLTSAACPLTDVIETHFYGHGVKSGDEIPIKPDATPRLRTVTTLATESIGKGLSVGVMND